MRYFYMILSLVLVTFSIWQINTFIAKARIIEVLPVATAQNPRIDPMYPEPVRVVFDKSIATDEVSFIVEPKVSLEATTRLVRLRDKNNTSFYPAFVLNNAHGLKENTEYKVRVELKKRSIFDFLLPTKVSVQFKTTINDKTLPRETGEDLDKRLFRK